MTLGLELKVGKHHYDFFKLISARKHQLDCFFFFKLISASGSGSHEGSYINYKMDIKILFNQCLRDAVRMFSLIIMIYKKQFPSANL